MITKQALWEATLRVAARKSFDKITIKDIVCEAQVTRQTFYYYFQDIIGMFEWKIEEETRALAEKNKNCSSLEHALMDYYEMMAANKIFISKISISRYYPYAVHLTINSIYEYLKIIYQNNPDFIGRNSVKDTAFLLKYHASAIAATFIQCLKKKNSLDVSESIRLIAYLIQMNLTS